MGAELGVKSLGYVVVEATDLAAWTRFATEVLGVMVGASPSPDVLWLRLDDRPFRLWIQKGERDGFVAPGWEFGDKAEFDAALQRLRDAGRPVQLAPVMEARARQVYELARSSDPDGNAMELYYGRFYDYSPFVSPAAVSGFVTGDNGDMGLGHVVLTAPKFDETYAFYKSTLGFRDTDLGRFYLAGGGPDDAGVGFAFLHAENTRHHSLALGQMPESPNGAVHMMLEVREVDDVGRAYDKVLKGAAPLSATLGRHVNDKMLSFYMQTPAGFDIEYGCHGLQIDPDRWVATTSLPVSAWGHKWRHESAETA
jgi:3,4-dihydroxy-9,10-secoandrosta-1,3,5(10)-triene-9,17-dione 4,5-dioxygenase